VLGLPEDVRVDPVVLAFGLAVAVVVGVVSGVAPAWRLLRGDARSRVRETLNDAQRTATVSRGQRAVRRALVTAQVWVLPAPTADTVAPIAVIATGVERLVVVPSPSWPR
jgi:hypothetical protein